MYLSIEKRFSRTFRETEDELYWLEYGYNYYYQQSQSKK